MTSCNYSPEYSDAMAPGGGYANGMKRPQYSLRQLFLAILLMAVGMGSVGFAHRSLEHRTLPWALGLVAGGVLIVFGAIVLITKHRRAKALMWVALGVAAGLMNGGLAIQILVPNFNQRYLTPAENHLVETIQNVAVFGGALTGYLSVFVATVCSDAFSEKDRPISK